MHALSLVYTTWCVPQKEETMHLAEFEHLQPASLDEALDLLGRHGQEARVIAGGTDLLVAMKQGLVAPGYLVNLKAIPELDFIVYDEKEGLRIGALTRLAALRRSPLVQEHLPILAQAAHRVAAPPIQTMGTLGGNLSQDTRCLYYNQSACWRQGRPACFKAGGQVCHVVRGSDHCHSAYQGDLAPVLIALGAQARIASTDGERTIPLHQLYTGQGEQPIGLAPGEVLTEVQVPRPASPWGGDYQKLRYRGAIDYPLVGVAAVVGRAAGGECAYTRVVLTAVVAAPVIVAEAGKRLVGQRLDDALIAQAAEAAYAVARPVANVGSTPSYRRRMVRVLTRRAITNAWRNGRVG
jgi:4-hydroxybenzoyl-CoA reductase subunit beta